MIEIHQGTKVFNDHIEVVFEEFINHGWLVHHHDADVDTDLFHLAFEHRGAIREDRGIRVGQDFKRHRVVLIIPRFFQQRFGLVWIVRIQLGQIQVVLHAFGNHTDQWFRPPLENCPGNFLSIQAIAANGATHLNIVKGRLALVHVTDQRHARWRRHHGHAFRTLHNRHMLRIEALQNIDLPRAYGGHRRDRVFDDADFDLVEVR